MSIQVSPEHDRLAGEISARMQELAAEGIHGSAVLSHMTKHMFGLMQILAEGSNEELVVLRRTHPPFQEYMRLMGESSAAERERITRSFKKLPDLPEPLKGRVLTALITGISIEKRLQAAFAEPDSPYYVERVEGMRMFMAQWWERAVQIKRDLEGPGIRRPARKAAWSMLHKAASRMADKAVAAHPDIDPRTGG